MSKPMSALRFSLVLLLAAPVLGGCGDRYSTLFKFITDLELKKGDTGALFRVKGWYDQALNDENALVGHQNTGYAGSLGGSGPARPLSDRSFDPLARFDGLQLLDAYVYTSFDIGGKTAQVRVGNQALNWGEQEFIRQGSEEDRTIEETLEIGWKLLATIDEAWLTKIDRKTLEKYHPAHRGTAPQQVAT